jgi:AraC-like DNA-binding protein
MANPCFSDPKRFVEFGNLANDYPNGGVIVIDHVDNLASLFPLKPMTTLVAICTDGSQDMEANGRSIRLTAGDVLVCPSNVHLSTTSQEAGFTCDVLLFSDRIIQALLRDHIDVWHHAVYVNQLNIMPLNEDGKKEFAMFSALINIKLRHTLQSSPSEITQTLIRAFLLELCILLENSNSIHHEHKMSQGKLLFNKFLSLVSNSDIKRQPILYYAGQLAITPKYLTMLCLKYSDKTASDWVVQYALEDIRFYLKSTDLSIKEISAKLGFANMSHFGSYVRKHLGVSPSEYRFSKKQ